MIIIHSRLANLVSLVLCVDIVANLPLSKTMQPSIEGVDILNSQIIPRHQLAKLAHPVKQHPISLTRAILNWQQWHLLVHPVVHTRTRSTRAPVLIIYLLLNLSDIDRQVVLQALIHRLLDTLHHNVKTLLQYVTIRTADYPTAAKLCTFHLHTRSDVVRLTVVCDSQLNRTFLARLSSSSVVIDQHFCNHRLFLVKIKDSNFCAICFPNF